MNGETGELAGAARQLGSRYLLGELIGRGGMGRVYAGTERDTGRPVAIKVLRPELVSDPDTVARFLQERQILTSIDSPAIVRIIDLVAEGETLAIVMELVTGQDLGRYLRTRQTLPPAEAVGLTVQLLTGLAVVHAAGVVHRDIKPENLLLDTQPGGVTLKVTDFGVARLSYGTTLTKLSSVIGTPEYMAPELGEGHSASPAADVYSAGVVLYEMLSGRTPFAGGPPVTVLRRHADMAPPPVPGLPPALWDRLSRMLAKDPAARPASAEDAAAALSALTAELAPLPALPPMAAPAGYQRVTADGAAPAVPHGDTGSIARHRGPGAPVAVPGSASATVVRHRDLGAGLAAGDGAAPPAGPGTRTRSASRWRLPALLAGAAAVVIAAAALTVPKLLHSPAPSPTLTISGAAATQAAPATAPAADATSSAAAPAQSTSTGGQQSAAVTAPTTAAPTTAAVTTAAAPTTAAPPAVQPDPAPATTITTTAAPPAAAASSVSVTLPNNTTHTSVAYFGQLSAVEAALSGQVTLGPLTSAGSDPAACVETVVFFQIGTNDTAVVGSTGLGAGWRGAEDAPSSRVAAPGNAHQQLVAPPLGVAPGMSYSAGATLAEPLVSTNMSTSAFSLSLQSTAGSVQTWLVAGQAVSCDS